MAAPDPHPATLPSKLSTRFRATACAGLLLSTGLVACAAPAPRAKTESQVPSHDAAAVAAATPTATPPPVATPAAPETPAPAPAEKSNILVEIDPGGEKGSSGDNLVEAAKAEKARKAQAGPSRVVINDKNLHHYAKKGQLTVAKPEVKPDVIEGSGDSVLKDEPYWRSRALEIRLRWRHAADDVKDLEQTSTGWRRRFYAENNPSTRNTQIKPEWDRVLDRLQRARVEVDTAKKDLADFLEEGRIAGALPGWLREGIDQEPKEEPPPSDVHKVIEPPKADAKVSPP
jgi:hypothetical protein